MVTALLALAFAQLSDAERSQMVHDFLGPERVSNRLDCRARGHAVGNGASGYPGYETDYVFLFPIRPHLQGQEARTQVRFIRSMRDGRSWIVEGRILAAQWSRWPHFSARLADVSGEIALQSDPQSPGRVTLSGLHPTSHGPDFEEQGECRFVPEIPTLEAPAR
jgi:hypothetical protein